MICFTCSLNYLLSYKLLKALYSLELYNGVPIANDTIEAIKCKIVMILYYNITWCRTEVLIK